MKTAMLENRDVTNLWILNFIVLTFKIFTSKLKLNISIRHFRNSGSTDQQDYYKNVSKFLQKCEIKFYYFYFKYNYLSNIIH